MTTPADKIQLSRMLEFAQEALGLVQGRQRADLEGERVMVLALAKLLHIIESAARHVSSACQAAHPEIAWSRMTRLHDQATRADHSIDYDRLWRVLESDLPDLMGRLRAIVGGI